MHHKKEDIETACVSYTQTPLSIPPYDSLTNYCHSLFNHIFQTTFFTPNIRSFPIERKATLRILVLIRFKYHEGVLL